MCRSCSRHPPNHFSLRLLRCWSQMMFNKNLICFAFVLDKMVFVTPNAFLLRCLSRGNIEQQTRVQGQIWWRNETINVLLHHTATSWLKMAAVTFLFHGLILNTALFVSTLQPSWGHKAECTVINQ